MNVLASEPDRPYTIATNVIEAFQRTRSETLAAAPQFKNVAMRSLPLQVENQLTLAELPTLLMNADFRDSC